MWCRGVGAAYDILHFKHPIVPFTLDGMEWSSPYNQQDVSWADCAAQYGGNWWFKNCSVFTPTTVNPVWYNLADTTFRPMKKSRLMIKPQQ